VPEGLLFNFPETIPKEEEEVMDKRSPVELLFSAAEKSEQTAREAVKQIFLSPDQPLYTKPFKEIFEGKRQSGDDKYTSEEFRVDLYKKFGLDQPGQVEESWSPGAKFGADVATDLIFNADNLIFGLPGKIVGGAGKLASESLKAVDLTKGSKALKILEKLDPKTLSRVTSGAVLGSTMRQEDDDAIDVLQKILIGAAGGLMFSPGAGKILEKVSKVADNKIDAFNQTHRPQFYKEMQRLMQDVPLDERLGLQSDVGVKNLTNIAGAKERDMLQRAHYYRKELEQIESGLNESQLDVYDNLRVRAAGMSKNLRDQYYKKLKEKLTAGGRKLTSPDKHAMLNLANKRANSIVGKKMLPLIMEADPSGRIVKTMDDFVKFNIKKVDEYNKLIPENKNPYLVGFDYYMPSILDDVGEPVQKLVRSRGGFKRVRSVSDPDLAKMTRGEVRDLAAQRYSQAFLSGQERTARMLLAAMHNTPLTSSGGKFFDTVFDGFDRFNKLIVAGQLFAHSGWVATNYLDNLGRAFMVGGLGPALKSAVGGGLGIAHSVGRVAIENSLTAGSRKLLEKIPLTKPVIDFSAKALNRLSKSTLMGEILESTHPSAVGKGVYDSDILELAHVTGVIDTDKARQFLQHWDQYGGIRTANQNNVPKIFKVLDNAIANSGGAAEDMLKAARLGGKAANLTTKAITGALSETIARIGSANEAYTRIKTFEHVYKALLKEAGGYKYVKKVGYANAYQQGLYKEIADRAAQIVDDTFFDYSKVTAFERAVSKRIMPYWTFYTRNAHFWLKSMTDPKKVGRVIKNARALKSIGREPTEEERKFISKYKLEEGARVLPQVSPDGRKVIVSIPGSSLLEAFNDATGLVAMAGKAVGIYPKGVTSERIKATEKLSPILKPFLELAMGKELFTGQPALPSEGKDQRKRVFSDALVTKALFDGPLSFIPYKTKIYVDQKGRDYFITDDTDARVIIVRRNWFPLRALESMYGYARDTLDLFGRGAKRTPLEAGIHYWTPFSVKPYTSEEQIKGIKRGIAKKKRGMKIKAGMRELSFGESDD